MNAQPSRSEFDFHEEAAEAARGATGVGVVTGGSAGIGRATVRLFAQRGWDVAISDYDRFVQRRLGGLAARRSSW